MNIRNWAKLALATPLLLAGCKGFWNAPTTTGGGTTTASSGDFYVLNVATNQIAGFYVSSGTLTPLTGSPWALPAAAFSASSITVSPNNGLLYVSTAGGIYLYTIGSNGALSIGNSGGPITTDQAVSMQVDKNNGWLVEVASGLPYVYAMPINSSTGVLTSQVKQYATLSASTPQQLAISPDNSYVIVADGTGGTSAIPFTSGNVDPLGAVTTFPVKNAGGAAISVAVDPDATPRLFYVGETVSTSGSNTGGLRVFNFSTLPSATEISGSPFATQGLAPYDILPKSTGDFVYVVNRQVSGSNTGVIAGFSIASSNSTYSLTALSSTFSVGTNPVALVEDNTAAFVFAVDFGGSPDLMGYTFDSKTAGALDQVLSKATGTDPVQASAIAAAH